MTNSISAVSLYFIGAMAVFSCESPPSAKDTALNRTNTAISANLKKLVPEKRYTISEFLNSEIQTDSFEAGAGSHLYFKINLSARPQSPEIETAILLHQDSVSMLLQKRNGNWILADTFSVRFLCMRQRDSIYYCSIPEVWTEDFNQDGLDDLVITESYGFSGRCPQLIFLNHGNGDINLLNRGFDLIIPEYDTAKKLIICPLTGRSPYNREGIAYTLRQWQIKPLKKITVENDSQSDSLSGFTVCLYEGRKNKWALVKKHKFNRDEEIDKFVRMNWPY